MSTSIEKEYPEMYESMKYIEKFRNDPRVQQDFDDYARKIQKAKEEGFIEGYIKGFEETLEESLKKRFKEEREEVLKKVAKKITKMIFDEKEINELVEKYKHRIYN